MTFIYSMNSFFFVSSCKYLNLLVELISNFLSHLNYLIKLLLKSPNWVMAERKLQLTHISIPYLLKINRHLENDLVQKISIEPPIYNKLCKIKILMRNKCLTCLDPGVIILHMVYCDLLIKESVGFFCLLGGWRLLGLLLFFWLINIRVAFFMLTFRFTFIYNNANHLLKKEF